MDMVGVSMAPIVIILDLTITTQINREWRQEINLGQPNQTKPNHPFREQYKEAKDEQWIDRGQNYQLFEKTNEEKEKQHGIQSTKQPTTPTMTGKEQLHRLKEKRKEKRERRRKDSIRTVGSLQLSTWIECASLSFPIHAHVAAPSRILIADVFPFEWSRSYCGLNQREEKGVWEGRCNQFVI